MGVKTFRLSKTELESKKYLNKFMPLERALELLNNKSLWFANPTIWNDPYEKWFICATYDGGRPFAWKERVFCSCFTDNATSEASWNAYSGRNDCVQVTFNCEELRKLLDAYSSKNPKNQVYFDSVEYMQTKEIKKTLSKIKLSPPLTAGSTIRSMEFKERLLLIKRKAFEYEKEYRVIIVKPKTTKENGIKVEFSDIKPLISSITIGPGVGSQTFAMLKTVLCRDYGFESKEVKQSYLYKSLPSKITIKT